MDIIEKRRKKREEIINKITEALNKLLNQYGKDGLRLTFKSMLISIEANFRCSTRTASEYANVALYKANLLKSDLPYKDSNYTMRLEIE